MKRKPDFFIVGAPKCGTTSMHHYLSSHPDIFMPQRKEPHFFGGGRNAYPNSSWDDYLGNFKEAAHEKRIGEASTGYLYSYDACKKIYQYDANARIIIMLRNPVDMIYAWHSEMVWQCDEDEKDFRSALMLEPKRRIGRNTSKKQEDDLIAWRLMYRECGCYYEYIKQYIEMFGRDQVHIIVFEEFVNKTKDIYKECLDFLEVDSTFTPQFHIVNSNRYPRWWPLRQWIRKSDSLMKKMTLAYVPQRLRKFLNKLTHYEKPRPPIPDDLRLELAGYFANNISKLENLTGVDFSAWRSV
jgi:hypothetical protein